MRVTNIRTAAVGALWHRAQAQQLAITALLFVAVIVISLPTLVYPLAPDHGVFAVIARGIQNGQLPYVDLWEVKPPAVYYVYTLAFVLFGDSTQSLRLMDIIWTALTCVAVYAVGVRLKRHEVGLWAVLLFAALYYRQAFWVPFENDALAVLPMVLGALLTLQAGDSSPGSHTALWNAFGAGVLAAVAFWFKYPFALFAIALAIAHVIRRHPVQWRALWKEIGAYTGGGLLVIGVVVVYFAAVGALDDMIQTAQVTVGYSTLSYSPREFMSTMREPILSQLSLLNLGWILLLVARWPFDGERSTLESRRWSVIWLWLFTGIAIVLVQAKGFAYHWQPMLPPLALMAADSLDILLRRAVSGLRRLSSAALYTAFSLLVALGLVMFTAATTWDDALGYLRGTETQLEYYNKLYTGPALAADSLLAAEYLQARVPDGETLYVFGFRPEVYYMSGLQPATRFMFLIPVVGDWHPPEWRDEVLESLADKRPPYILVVQNDRLGQLTGQDKDSVTLLHEFTRLRDWLTDNYRLETEIGDFLVWRDTRL